MQPNVRREGERSGHRDLERTGIPVEGGGQLVEVLAPEGGRPRSVSARSIDETPSRRLQIDGEVHEQPGGAADDVPARSASGQLRQRRYAAHPVRLLVVIAEQLPLDPQGLGDIGPRPRADPTRRGHSP